MRSTLLPPLAIILVVIGFVTFVATRGQSCEDAFGPAETRLERLDGSEIDERMVASPDGGLGQATWVLRTPEPEFDVHLVEVGGWTAYADDVEISRIEVDGTIAWTRSTPSQRPVALGDGLLGVRAFVDSTLRLAVIDREGQLVRCDRLAAIDGGVAGAGDGGYATVGGTPDQSERDVDPSGDGRLDDRGPDVVRRVEADGSERWSAELAGGPGRYVDHVFVGGGLTVVGRADPPDAPILSAFDDETGDRLWVVDDQSPGIAPVETIAGIADGTLYVTLDGEDPETNALLAVDTETGQVRWSTPMTVDTFQARAALIEDTLVLRTSAVAIGLDPTSGQPLWQSVGRPAITEAGDQGFSIREVGGRPLYPTGDRLVDLGDGRSVPLFDEVDTIVNVTAVISDDSAGGTDGDVLIVETWTRVGRQSVTFVSGWPFDPAAAEVEDQPLRPEGS